MSASDPPANADSQRILQSPTRRSAPFGLPKTPFDPQTGLYASLEGPCLDRFIVQVEKDDYLECLNRYGRTVFVAKPFLLRKTAFDGKTINDLTYEYPEDSAAERTVTNADSEIRLEAVNVPYVLEYEEIFARRQPSGIWSPTSEEDTREFMGSEDGGPILWEDVNIAGRSWCINIPPIPQDEANYMLVYDADSGAMAWIETTTECP